MNDKIKSISTFKVDNLWAVYEEDKKQFKSKIHAILCTLNNEGVLLRPITTLELR